MQRRVFGFGSVLVMVAAAGVYAQPANLPFSDDFDSYNANAGLSAQSNIWETWDNIPTVDAVVSAEQARSGANSAKTVAAELGFSDSDLILQLDDPSNWQGDCYELITYQYLPSDQNGESYWIVQSIYAHGGTKVWAVQIHMNAATGVATADFGGETIPVKVDTWVELRVLVDFNGDLHQVYYDGQPFFAQPISWINAMNGGNAPEMASLDWYANLVCCAYYDDLTVREIDGDCPFAGDKHCIYSIKKNTKAKKGCAVCPRKGDAYETEATCEDVGDCPKKISVKQIPCPDGGRGFCKKLKAKKATDCA